MFPRSNATTIVKCSKYTKQICMQYAIAYLGSIAFLAIWKFQQEFTLQYDFFSFCPKGTKKPVFSIRTQIRNLQQLSVGLTFIYNLAWQKEIRLQKLKSNLKKPPKSCWKAANDPYMRPQEMETRDYKSIWFTLQDLWRTGDIIPSLFTIQKQIFMIQNQSRWGICSIRAWDAINKLQTQTLHLL